MKNAPEDWGALVGASASDPKALAKLYRAFGQDVRSFLRRILPQASIEDADDLCQEVFIRVPKAASAYRGDASVKSWLFGIATRVARGRNRHYALRRSLWLARRPPSAAPVAGPDPTPRLDIQRAIEALPPHHREVLVMTVAEGLAAKDVAAALGIREKTVWTRLHRARAALRAALNAEAKDD